MKTDYKCIGTQQPNVQIRFRNILICEERVSYRDCLISVEVKSWQITARGECSALRNTNAEDFSF